MNSEKKLVSILIPCYNEEENVEGIYKAVKEEIETNLQNYDYEIVFIDNKSTDKTRNLLRIICQNDKKVRAILNSKNFGQFNSPVYGLIQTKGDCTILICADFQDPINLIPEFVKEWENGYKIVCGIKSTSKENALMYFLRTCYYKTIKKMSSVGQIEHFTGFGLYDCSFIETLRNLNDPIPFLRGIVAELGPERKEIKYEQQKRRAGKTHNNLYTLYDGAMLSFTSYTKIGLRIATFVGFIMAGLCFLISIGYFAYKLFNWDSFDAGIAPLTTGMFLIAGVQLVFIGLLGEYIMNINTRVMNRPLVIEEERLNFDD